MQRDCKESSYWRQRADERLDNRPQGNQEPLVVKVRVGRPPGELRVIKSIDSSK